MTPSAFAIAFMGLYAFGCMFVVYYCIFSFPHDSEIAYFVQVTLPNASWNRLRRIFGDNAMQVVRYVTDRGLILMYFVIVGGGWSIVFGKLYPWMLNESPSLSNIHAIVGVFVFLACFTAWAVANASRPGNITARSFRRYDHYPYDHLLFQPNQHCQTTKLFKIPRSKYDRIKYDGIVPRYDHFCGWTHNTYGAENYRWFLLFLLQHVIMCFYGTYVSYLLFFEEIKTKRLMELTFFDRLTGETVQASYYIIFQYVFARRTLEVGLALVMFVMGIALSCFLGYHVYITSVGQTTNENSKWGDVRKWHKKQQYLYQTAVREGKVATKSQNSDSGDNNGNNDDTEEQEQQELVDPGPIPKNLYNRGFVENWKEVFFPISLRKDALSRGGYTKASIQRQRQQQQQQNTPQNAENIGATGSSSASITESLTNSTIRSNKPKDI